MSSLVVVVVVKALQAGVVDVDVEVVVVVVIDPFAAYHHRLQILRVHGVVVCVVVVVVAFSTLVLAEDELRTCWVCYYSSPVGSFCCL